MRSALLMMLVGVSLLAGCANPINRATSDNYSESCATAERNGRAQIAEQACYRALVNVELALCV
jgi:hypothetical protein